MTYLAQSNRPVVALDVDLLGDGLPAPVSVTGSDLRAFTAAAFTAPREGRYSLHIRATDDAGCSDQTGLERPVVVTR